MELTPTPKFNKVNVTKFVANKVVIAAAATIVSRIIKRVLPGAPDLAVDLTGGIAGWYVGEQLQPLTDKLSEDAWAYIEKNQVNQPLKAV